MSRFKSAVLGVIGRKLMAQARVDDVEVLSDHFRLITMSSEKFKVATMQPAAKVRLNAGNWEMRAYTPLSIDTVAGRLKILAYLHGNGPGSTWSRSAVPGDRTHFIGPQPSLDLNGHSAPAVFFGDETSFAAAKTLQSHLTLGNTTRFIFEISSGAEARAIADRLQLLNTQCYDRQADDGHIPLITEAVQHALVDNIKSQLVLTGNARSIQALRARLRTSHSGVIDYRVKPYWSPGKTGME